MSRDKSISGANVSPPGRNNKEMSGANVSPLGRNNKEMSGANVSPPGRNNKEMSGANVSPLGRNNKEMSGANVSPLGRNNKEMTYELKQAARRICERIASKGRNRGFLIAFEGPDGSGKTTQRKLFKDWLVAEGIAVTTT